MNKTLLDAMQLLLLLHLAKYHGQQDEAEIRKIMNKYKMQREVLSVFLSCSMACLDIGELCDNDGE